MSEQRQNASISTADLAGGRPEKPEEERRQGQTDATTRTQPEHAASPAMTPEMSGTRSPSATGSTTNGSASEQGHDRADDDNGAMPLIPQAAASSYRDRWTSIQTNFVDEPQNAVREADGLVAEVIQRVAQRFAEERHNLEGQWSSGAEASTEDLRQALQHYRDFFRRLLAA
jgi:hypothetical protein